MATLKRVAGPTLANVLGGMKAARPTRQLSAPVLNAAAAAAATRHFSTTRARPLQITVPEWASQEAREALEGFAARFDTGDASESAQAQPQPILIDPQRLSETQLGLLRLTLAEMVPLVKESPVGDEASIFAQRREQVTTMKEQSWLLPTEHLAFFPPRVPSSTLGADGSDTSFNPPGGVFTRRMWAGGEMKFYPERRIFRIGERAIERTFIEDAQLKQLGNGRGEMIVVWVRKEFSRSADRGGKESPPCIVDRRSWVFQRALPPKAPSSSGSTSTTTTTATSQEAESATEEPPAGVFHEDFPAPQRVVQTPASLFRYSALTFNSHAIHLSPTWAKEVEGHQDIVVHGPLTLTLLARKWGKDIGRWKFIRGEGGKAVEPASARRLRSITYRAKKPLYVGEPYWLGFAKEGQEVDTETSGEGKHKLIAVKADGSIAMEATIVSIPPPPSPTASSRPRTRQNNGRSEKNSNRSRAAETSKEEEVPVKENASSLIAGMFRGGRETKA